MTRALSRNNSSEQDTGILSRVSSVVNVQKSHVSRAISFRIARASEGEFGELPQRYPTPRAMHLASGLRYHCDQTVFSRWHRVAHVGAPDARSCLLLRLFGSSRVSSRCSRATRGGYSTGSGACAVHTRCIRLSLPLFLSSRVQPTRHGSARLDSARFRPRLAEGHRARRPQLSWQFVPNGDDFLPATGHTVAAAAANFPRESSATRDRYSRRSGIST